MSLILSLLLASSAPSTPFDIVAHRATLDDMMKREDYKAFGELVFSPKSAEEGQATLDWMKDQWFAGTSAIVPMFYARLLWGMSDNWPKEHQEQIRGTAGAAILYTYGVTFIDGARCGDKSAPEHRRDQLASFIPGLWTTITSYPLEQRRQMIQIAVGMERRTSAVRDANDDVKFLCENGLEEMSYNLKHGSVKEAPPQPGQIGKNMVVSGDGTYKPTLLDEKTWRPVAEKARADMARSLSTLMLTPDEMKASAP